MTHLVDRVRLNSYSRYSSGGTWRYDWLNRMTQSPSLDGTGPTTWNYTNDILGNRTNRNLHSSNAAAAIFTWDPLNRMTNLYRPSVGASYYYRADGMRVEKVDGATLSWVPPDPADSRASGHYDTNYGSNRATTRYFYDGQMPMEEDYNPSGTVTKVTRNTLGGRGIDMISTTESSTTTVVYPLYDGHGNMVATLGKNGSGGYTTANWRTYDVWGSVRSGATSGGPTKRYSANIGHQADDESDLLYMRARYYEPASGRFVSEDPASNGLNWYVYCSNQPVTRVDESGTVDAETAGYYGWILFRVVVVINGVIRSKAFLPLFTSMVVAGFLALTPCLCGVGVIFGAVAVGMGLMQSVQIMQEIYKIEGFWPKFKWEFSLDKPFPEKQSNGLVSECVNFLSSWYAFLSLAFQFVEPLISGI